MADVRNLELESYERMLQDSPRLAIMPGIMEQMQRLQGYQNAGAQASQIARQNPGTLARATVAGGQQQGVTNVAPGNSQSAQSAAPGQFGVQPAAQATPQFGAVSTNPAIGQPAQAKLTQTAPAGVGMQFADANETGFTISIPGTGDAKQQGLDRVMQNNMPGVASVIPRQQFRVTYGQGEFDPTTGKMNVDFTKFGGQKYQGTFADLSKMDPAAQAKVFGNFTAPQQANKSGAVDAAKQEAAGGAKQSVNVPLPPQRPGTAKAAPQQQQNGTTPQPNNTGVTPGQQSAIDPTQRAMQMQQFAMELQQPDVLQALKMIGAA